MNDNTIFGTKLVSEIEGNFYISSYQRGYRWGTKEIENLLEDIYLNGEKNRLEHKDNKYCLQPIVVKKENDRYELIDGQQRLTTLYLIYKYMHKKIPDISEKPKFFIDYNKAREKTKEFLENIDFTKENDNIDFYFLSNAYKTIEKWFTNEETKKSITRFHDYLNEEVKIIWYEVEEYVNSIELFERLNIGKIPLTSSELVKAVFLSKDTSDKINSEKQNEIALQWDNMERELQNDNFWYFLTNTYADNYQTRIDLVLDLFINKPTTCKERYYTFDKIREIDTSLTELWKNIQQTFYILKDWFENHELYHKVGYLITTNSLTLQKIYELSKNKSKDIFIKKLNEEIKKSIAGFNYSSYDYNSNPDKIIKLLTLFNIETVRQNGEQTNWFPFSKFKNKGNNTWSLEHIHAQNSKTMDKKSMNKWLELHRDSLLNVVNENSLEDKELIEEINKWIDNPKLDEYTFINLREKIVKKLTTKTKYSYDSIANLALLNFKDNASLNNSTFDVKRNQIIEMDKKGHYIPFCTRMVFFKYYTESKDNQLHFWGQKDMEAYVEAINEKLEEYLDAKIELEMEEFVNE